MRRRFGKIGILCLGLTLCLLAIGVGYGFWSDSLNFRGTIDSGDIDCVFTATWSNDPEVPETDDPVSTCVWNPATHEWVVTPIGTGPYKEAFVDAYNAGNLDKVALYLSDDFKFSGPMPEPIDGTEWLGLLRIFKTAFPDINYNLRLVNGEGNIVHTTSQVNGTHTGVLDISAMGMGVFSPTGKAFSLPEEPGEAIVEDDKVKSIHVQSKKGSGVMGILAQLGIQPPSG